MTRAAAMTLTARLPNRLVLRGLPQCAEMKLNRPQPYLWHRPDLLALLQRLSRDRRRQDMYVTLLAAVDIPAAQPRLQTFDGVQAMTRWLARTISPRVRDIDVLGYLTVRHVLFVGECAAPDNATLIATRMLRTVEAASFEAGGTRIPLTVSIGACMRGPITRRDYWLWLLERALGEAQEAGGHCFRTAAPRALNWWENMRYR